MKLERLAAPGLVASLLVGGCQSDDLDLGGASESSIEESTPSTPSAPAGSTDSGTPDSAAPDSATSSGCHGWCLEHTADLESYFYFGVWCSSPNDCYAVGQEARVEHWDGTSWTLDPLTGVTAAVSYPTGGKIRLMTVGGTGPNDVWVAGDNHVILHFDGTSWNAFRPSPSDPTVGPYMYMGLSAVGPNNVYVIGSFGQTAHWTNTGGLSFTESVPEPNNLFFGAIWAQSPNDVWVVGEDWDAPMGAQAIARHWNGASWSMQSLPKTVASVHGFSANDIWAVGSEGAMLHHDGTNWSVVPGQADWSSNDVWGANPNDVWAVGNKTIHYDGTSWTDLNAPVEGGLEPIHGFMSVHGAGSTVRAVAGDKIYRYVP